MPELRYDGQVVVITGAGNGLGKEYAKFFGKRGAKVVVNDLGGTFNGETGNDQRVAAQVAEEIKAAGGIAVPDFNNVEQGEKIVETAIKAFGRIDVLINNAGILRDITLKNMTDKDWDLIHAVHLHGAYKTTRAAWPYFRKQKYGRIINTSSASGLFGNFGQSNYASAKVALIGFTETLAREGAKYNIHANVLAPGAASRLTQTVWTPEMMEVMKPDWVVPLVAVLVHSSNTETGAIFEAAAGHYSKIRWQRASGLQLRPDETMTAGVILKNWEKMHDYTNPGYSAGLSDPISTLEKNKALPPNPPAEDITFKNRVVLVTGGGEGLGRAYCHMFARLGAKVAVNDVANAETVANDIRKAGGDAIAIPISNEDGDAVVAAVLKAYGRIEIIVNNAGIIQDRAFINMTDEQWFAVYNVHLRGLYKVTRAAWPHMIKQKFGRIVNVTSTVGVYGNFGQANYAAAKSGIIGFSKSIAREGAKYNIHVNVLAPQAGTNMTRTIMPEDQVQQLKPEFVAPLVAAMCSDKVPGPPGRLYEAGSGFFAAARWQRARGVDFPHDQGVPSAEAVHDAIKEICNFDNGQADYPEDPGEGSKYSMGNIMKTAAGQGKALETSNEDRAKRRFLSKINAALDKESAESVYSYGDREVILYNLGLGAKRTDLPLVYEGDKNFQVLPTFGIIPTYFSKSSVEMKDIVPNFDMRMLLHGEQYMEILKFPIPTEGKLITKTKLVEVVDKGNAAVVRRAFNTVDASGTPIFYNENVAFIRGSGGFGGMRTPADRGAATAANVPPKRAPDTVVEETISEEAAAIYRLCGDFNPLHIDPVFSSAGGFKIPILHGLASFGISGKHVYRAYGPFKNIKVRFAGTVLPGQILRTSMWKEGNKVIYMVEVKDTGKVCISNAAVELMVGQKANL